CGRVNEDEAILCFECGTKFNDSAAPSTQVADYAETKSYLRSVLICAATLFLLLSLYALSLGPVVRYSATRGPTTVSTNWTGSGIVSISTMQTVRYPSWVNVFYRPLFSFAYRSDYEGTFRQLYCKYLHWWDQERMPGSP